MKVKINVYDIQKACNQKGADTFGVGIYHSGIEICGLEYAYGGNSCMKQTGVYELMPQCHSAFTFKTQHELYDLDPKDFKTCKNGRLDFDRDIWPLLEELMDKYRAYKYNMLNFNCNHFSNEFVNILYKGRVSIPNYINRAAYIGSWF